MGVRKVIQKSLHLNTMLTPADFLEYAKWSGIATIVFGVIALLGFLLKWGIRFRLVGTTGFMLVLTGGLFALSLVPLMRTQIPGAVHYSLAYDNGATQTVITVSPTITPSELEATLKQAASDLYSYGRLGLNENRLTIRARTIIHPEDKVSKPLYLGQVKRSLAQRDDEQLEVQLFEENLAQLPQPTA